MVNVSFVLSFPRTTAPFTGVAPGPQDLPPWFVYGIQAPVGTIQYVHEHHDYFYFPGSLLYLLRLHRGAAHGQGQLRKLQHIAVHVGSERGPGPYCGKSRTGLWRPCSCGESLSKPGETPQQQRLASPSPCGHVATESRLVVPGMLSVLCQEVSLLPKMWHGAVRERSEWIVLQLRSWMGRSPFSVIARLGSTTALCTPYMESANAFPETEVETEEARATAGRSYKWSQWIQGSVKRSRVAGCQLAAACYALASGFSQDAGSAITFTGRWQGRDPCCAEGRFCGFWPSTSSLCDGADGQDGGCGGQSAHQATPHHCQATWGSQTSALQSSTSSAGSSSFLAAICAEDSSRHRGWTGAVRQTSPGLRSAGERSQGESCGCQTSSPRGQFQGQRRRCSASRVGGLGCGTCASGGGNRLRRHVPAGHEAAAYGIAIGLPKASRSRRFYSQTKGQDRAPSMSRSCVVFSPGAQPHGTSSGNERPQRKPKPSHTYAADFYRTDLHSVRTEDEYKSPYLALLLGCLASDVLTLDSTVVLAVANAIGDTALHQQFTEQDDTSHELMHQSCSLWDPSAYCHENGAFWHMDSLPDVEPSLRQQADSYPSVTGLWASNKTDDADAEGAFERGAVHSAVVQRSEGHVAYSVAAELHSSRPAFNPSGPLATATCTPCLPTKSCLRQATTSSLGSNVQPRSGRHLQFATEVMFWFPEEGQLQLPYASFLKLHVHNPLFPHSSLSEAAHANHTSVSFAAPSMRGVEPISSAKGCSLIDVRAAPFIEEMEHVNPSLRAAETFEEKPLPTVVATGPCRQPRPCFDWRNPAQGFLQSSSLAAPSMCGVEHILWPCAERGITARIVCLQDCIPPNDGDICNRLQHVGFRSPDSHNNAVFVPTAQWPKAPSHRVQVPHAADRPCRATSSGLVRVGSARGNANTDHNAMISSAAASSTPQLYTAFDLLAGANVYGKRPEWDADACVRRAISQSQVP